jgi:hypothetical protein
VARLKWWLLKKSTITAAATRTCGRGTGAPEHTNKHGSCPVSSCRSSRSEQLVTIRLSVPVAAYLATACCERRSGESSLTQSHRRARTVRTGPRNKSIDEERWTTIRGKTKRFKNRPSEINCTGRSGSTHATGTALLINGPDGSAVNGWDSTGLEVSICLLTMEEDEAGGFHSL